MTDLHPGRYALALAQARRERGLSLNLGVIQFDPKKHPRDLKGQFKSAVSKLNVGQSLKLPDGTRVDRERSGYNVHSPDHGKTQAVDSASNAASKALAFSGSSKNPDSIGGAKSHPSADRAIKAHEAEHVTSDERFGPGGDEIPMKPAGKEPKPATSARQASPQGTSARNARAEGKDPSGSPAADVPDDYKVDTPEGEFNWLHGMYYQGYRTPQDVNDDTGGEMDENHIKAAMDGLAEKGLLDKADGQYEMNGKGEARFLELEKEFAPEDAAGRGKEPRVVEGGHPPKPSDAADASANKDLDSEIKRQQAAKPATGKAPEPKPGGVAGDAGAPAVPTHQAPEHLPPKTDATDTLGKPLWNSRNIGALDDASGKRGSDEGHVASVLSAIDAAITEDDPTWDRDVQNLYDAVRHGADLDWTEQGMLKDLLNDDLEASGENVANDPGAAGTEGVHQANIKAVLDHMGAGGATGYGGEATQWGDLGDRTAAVAEAKDFLEQEAEAGMEHDGNHVRDDTGEVAVEQLGIGEPLPNGIKLPDGTEVTIGKNGKVTVKEPSA